MRAAIVVAIAVLATTGATAQEPGSRMTREFVQAAAQSDAFEILEAQTALTESVDPEVRAFAVQMIEDHRTSSKALREAAGRAGLKPPAPGISGDQAMLLSGLQGQHGQDFDKTFARLQMVAHRGALTVQNEYAEKGDVPDLRKTAQVISQMVASHLSMAEQMDARFGHD